jgi:hypothetical protein
MLRADAKNIQGWLDFSEGDTGFQLLVFLQFLNKGSTATVWNVFLSALCRLLNFPFIYLMSFLFVF